MMSYRFMLQTTQWEKEIIFAAQYNNGATVVANPLMGRCIPAARPSTQPAYIYPDGTSSTITVSQGTSCLLMTWELYNTFKANSNDQRFQKINIQWNLYR